MDLGGGASTRFVLRGPDRPWQIARWNVRVDMHQALLLQTLTGRKRTVPCHPLSFPPDSAERFLVEAGEVHRSHADVRWLRVGL